jgi:uncharacterized protein YebE (UPF0316 family)
MKEKGKKKMNLFITFIILNIANVIIQTVKSIATIKCGKTAAALVNAVAYGLYTIVIVYTNADLNLWIKVAIVALANLIGVYVVKFIEEKKRKDKLWKIEFTVLGANTDNVNKLLEFAKVPHNFIPNVEKYTIFNAYCATQKESESVKEIIKQYNAKYFVSETKIL